MGLPSAARGGPIIQSTVKVSNEAGRHVGGRSQEKLRFSLVVEKEVGNDTGLKIYRNSRQHTLRYK